MKTLNKQKTIGVISLILAVIIFGIQCYKTGYQYGIIDLQKDIMKQEYDQMISDSHKQSDNEKRNDPVNCYHFERTNSTCLDGQGQEISPDILLKKLDSENKLANFEKMLSKKYNYIGSWGTLDGLGQQYAHFDLLKQNGFKYIKDEEKRKYQLVCFTNSNQTKEYGNGSEKYLLLSGLKDCMIIDNEFGSYQEKLDSQELIDFTKKINEEIKTETSSNKYNWLPQFVK